MFTHGNDIECPECSGSALELAPEGRHKVFLECIDRNYSGCSVDMAKCPECGKAYQISYKVDTITRTPTRDGPTRKERRVELQEKAKIWQDAAEEEERKEFARLQEKYGGQT